MLGAPNTTVQEGIFLVGIAGLSLEEQMEVERRQRSKVTHVHIIAPCQCAEYFGNSLLVVFILGLESRFMNIFSDSKPIL